MTTLTPAVAVRQMARHLTTPFGRGADTLALALVALGDAARADVAPYDFDEHRARFDRRPDPRYILVALQDIAAPTTVTLAFTALPGGPAQPPATLSVPGGTLAGASFVIDLGASEGPEARLTGLTMSPPAPGGDAAACWSLVALLGNTARLLWALGWERDQLRRQLARTTAQRQLKDALGLSLDLIGYDLGIPRFPPLPYSFDEATLALYHLNEPQGAAPPAEDVAGRYPGRTAHNGTLAGPVTPGAPARFDSGFAFGPGAVVSIAHDPVFDLGAADSFTVECFVQPARGATEGHLVSKHPDPAGALAGWALSVGDFGLGLPLNPRWKVSDGANPPLQLFADVSLSPERFTHLAGVIDRAAGLARLYVDGVELARAPLAGLQAVSSGEPVRIGHPAAALPGVVEEVRLSAVARAGFHPALGESDASYRHRLGFFRRWALPTPANLLAMLNAACGPVSGDVAPLVLDDRNTSIAGGAVSITVVPARLGPGESIDSLGNRGASEQAVCGTAEDESRFEPIFLVSHSDPRASYVAPEPRALAPGEPPPNSRLVQLAVERPLNRLLDLLAPEAGAGRLTVHSAFDPRAGDLRATGRALLLSHTTLDNGRLAALAHRAGFAFVRNRDDLGQVYAASAPGDYVELVVAPGPGPAGFDGLLGDTLALSVRPAMPPGTGFRWLTIACGVAEARFTGRQSDPTASLLILAPGELTVAVDVLRPRGAVSASRALRLGLGELASGAIGADGALGVGEGVAGGPEGYFHQAFLVRHDDPRATYGAAANNRLMQAAVAARLTRLLDLVAAAGAAGPVRVLSAFVPGAADLTAVGRGLTLRHQGLGPGRLAALAHAAGFSYVRRQDPDVVVRQAAADLLDLGPARVVEEGGTVSLAAAVAPAAVGPGVRLQWTQGAARQARARLSSTTLQSVELSGVQAGQARAQAVYLIGDAAAPYTFAVRLNPALEAANAIVRKEQYDMVMNMLNSYHPLGVEVTTGALRERVIELQGPGLEINPDYTYPRYRVRGPAPRRRKEQSLG